MEEPADQGGELGVAEVLRRVADGLDEPEEAVVRIDVVRTHGLLWSGTVYPMGGPGRVFAIAFD